MILMLDFKLTINLYTPWVASKINDISSLARKIFRSITNDLHQKNDFIIGRHMIVNRQKKRKEYGVVCIGIQ